MEPFEDFTALAVPLRKINVDTDQIIPKQFLRSHGAVAGKNCFHDWRYIEGDESRPNREFVLNLPRYRGARVLVGGDNFGCGSSREMAPWALIGFGFRCIVSSGFADIFFNNSIKNGLLPAVVAADDLATLMKEVEQKEGLTLTVQLEKQRLTTSTGLGTDFTIGQHAKQSLQKGLDEIEQTLQLLEKITEFEKKSRKNQPWLG